MSHLESTTGYSDDHLSRLLPKEVEEPWYKTFIENIRDTFNPPKLPPLEVTSKPVAVKSIWGMYDPDKKSFGYSSGILVVVLALLVTVFSSKAVQQQMKQTVSVLDPNVKPYVPDLKPQKDVSAGGGGGGDRSPTPASKGKLPKIAKTQFVPPQVIVHNEHPKLVMEPTIVAPDLIPNVNMAALGDPLSKIAEASNGIGSGGGIGSGNRGGVGSGDGAGFGPGHGGGYGGGAYKVGGGVSAPEVLYKTEPEYSEEARKAKYNGMVVLRIVVNPDGHVSNVTVTRGVGLGLDEKAIESVKQWRFKPGYKNGVAVPVYASVEVDFRLL